MGAHDRDHSTGYGKMVYPDGAGFEGWGENGTLVEMSTTTTTTTTNTTNKPAVTKNTQKPEMPK